MVKVRHNLEVYFVAESCYRTRDMYVTSEDMVGFAWADYHGVGGVC